MNDSTRRQFARAGMATALSYSRVSGANERVRMGYIVLGNRSDQVHDAFLEHGDQQTVAVCDLKDSYMDFAIRKSRATPRKYKDYKKLLEDKDIDAVVIATPDHWHALMFIDACNAGKDVYVEKPCSHNAFEGRQLVRAVGKHNRICQHGSQSRSNPGMLEAIRHLSDGTIGDVYMARCVHYQKRDSLGFKDAENAPNSLNWDLWVGPGPIQSFNRNLHPYNWHWFWDFGNGELGNNGIHYIDVARWGMNKGLPSKIYSTGGRFGYKDQGQTPNTQLTTYQFDDGTEMVMEIRGRYTNSEGGVSSGLMFYGSKGYMISDSDSEKFKVFLEGRSTPEPDMGKLDDVDRTSDEELSHFQNFFDAVRAGKRDMLTAEINETYLSTAFCLLGNISYRLKRELRFDPGANRFVGDREADEMLRDQYRAPFSIPEKV